MTKMHPLFLRKRSTKWGQSLTIVGIGVFRIPIKHCRTTENKNAFYVKRFPRRKIAPPISDIIVLKKRYCGASLAVFFPNPLSLFSSTIGPIGFKRWRENIVGTYSYCREYFLIVSGVLNGSRSRANSSPQSKKHSGYNGCRHAQTELCGCPHLASSSRFVSPHPDLTKIDASCAR